MSEQEEEEVPFPTDDKDGAADTDQESNEDNDTANPETPDPNDISLVDTISSRIRFVQIQGLHLSDRSLFRQMQ